MKARSRQTVTGKYKRAERVSPIFAFLCLLAVILSIDSTEAQQSNKVPQIAFLGGTGTPVWSARIDSLRQGLRELGYMDKKNMMITYRPLEQLNPISALRAELARLKIDVIVSAGSSATLPRRQL